MKNTKILFTMLLLIKNFLSHPEESEEKPCISLKGLFSPINIINLYNEDLFSILDPRNKNFKINLLDILKDKKNNQYKFVYEIDAVEFDAKSYFGILSQVSKKENKIFHKVIKFGQSYEIEDIKFMLKIKKDKILKKKIDCPFLKKHFADFYKKNNSGKKEIGIEDKNLERQRKEILKVEKNPNLELKEIYKEFDDKILQNLPDNKAFNITYNEIVKKLSSDEIEETQIQKYLQDIVELVNFYNREKNKQILKNTKLKKNEKMIDFEKITREVEIEKKRLIEEREEFERVKKEMEKKYFKEQLDQKRFNLNEKKIDESKKLFYEIEKKKKKEVEKMKLIVNKIQEERNKLEDIKQENNKEIENLKKKKFEEKLKIEKIKIELENLTREKILEEENFEKERIKKEEKIKYEIEKENNRLNQLKLKKKEKEAEIKKEEKRLQIITENFEKENLEIKLKKNNYLSDLQKIKNLLKEEKKKLDEIQKESKKLKEKKHYDLYSNNDFLLTSRINDIKKINEEERILLNKFEKDKIYDINNYEKKLQTNQENISNDKQKEILINQIREINKNILLQKKKMENIVFENKKNEDERKTEEFIKQIEEEIKLKKIEEENRLKKIEKENRLKKLENENYFKKIEQENLRKFENHNYQRIKNENFEKIQRFKEENLRKIDKKQKLINVEKKKKKEEMENRIKADFLNHQFLLKNYVDNFRKRDEKLRIEKTKLLNHQNNLNKQEKILQNEILSQKNILNRNFTKENFYDKNSILNENSNFGNFIDTDISNSDN